MFTKYRLSCMAAIANSKETIIFFVYIPVYTLQITVLLSLTFKSFLFFSYTYYWTYLCYLKLIAFQQDKISNTVIACKLGIQWINLHIFSQFSLKSNFLHMLQTLLHHLILNAQNLKTLKNPLIVSTSPSPSHCNDGCN